MRKRRTARALLASSAAALLVAMHATSCASASNPECERNSDCDHAYCVEGKCHTDCVDAALDCPKGYACNAIGQCEYGGGGAGGESSGGASGEGGTSGGTSGGAGTSGAGTSGAGTSGAGTGGAGASGGGAGTGGSASGSGGSNAGTGGASNAGTGGTVATGGAAGTGGFAGSVSSGGTTGSGGNPFGGGGMPTGTKHELDRCTSDADCQPPLACRADWKGGPARCTRACSTNADCFGGRRCELVGGDHRCVGGDVGRACNAADQCNFACLLGQQYCTSTCTTGADCPNGYGCEPVGTPPTSVCVKVEAACDADTSACIAPSACDTSLLVSSCTMACNTAADCPQRAAGLPAWSCQSGICKRPPDVMGPLAGGVGPTQWACDASQNVVNLCNDAQHIDFVAFTIPPPPAVNCSSPTTTSGQSSDSCVDSCTYQGGCAWGFACVAVGSIGGARIGLCLPEGAGEPGTACSNDTECAFGYCSMGTCSRDCTGDGLCPTGKTCTPAGGPPVGALPFQRCE